MEQADLELVVFPADAAAYYGPDKEFKDALAGAANTWKPVQREAAGNALKCDAKHGSVLNPYPLKIAVDAKQTAEITIKGGLGYLPVTFTGLTAASGYARKPLRQPNWPCATRSRKPTRLSP